MSSALSDAEIPDVEGHSHLGYRLLIKPARLEQRVWRFSGLLVGLLGVVVLLIVLNNFPVSRVTVPLQLEKFEDKLEQTGLGNCSGTLENCWESKCCSDPSKTCFVKDMGWAECKQSCTQGLDLAEAKEYRTPWTCEQLHPEPTQAPDPSSPSSTPIALHESNNSISADDPDVPQTVSNTTAKEVHVIAPDLEWMSNKTRQETDIREQLQIAGLTQKEIKSMDHLSFTVSDARGKVIYWDQPASGNVMFPLTIAVKFTLQRDVFTPTQDEAPRHFCCLWASDVDNVCGTCESKDKEHTWCGVSEDKCTGCGKQTKWCAEPARLGADASPAVTVVDPPSSVTNSLYCFSLMRPRSYEVDLLRTQFAKNVGIFLCDKHSVFSNEAVVLNPGSPSSAQPVKTEVVEGSLECTIGGKFMTALNTQIFIRIWKKVFSDGLFQQYDWTAKVDPDAVFLPRRLREHLSHYLDLKHQTPAGLVYINNCKDGLHGPIEVISHGGMEAYSKGIGRCEEALQSEYSEWGEDVFVRHCNELLFVERADDFGLLSETHCDPFPFDPMPCVSGKVAFHPLKRPEDYVQCLEQANMQT